MNTLLGVARYHLVDRIQYTAIPTAATAFAFAVNLAIFAVLDPPEGGGYSGGLLVLCGMLLVLGMSSVSRSLPFGFVLGLSRRAYYLGTVTLVFGLGAAYGLGIAVLQAVERVTGGWGKSMHFFRVAWFLDGPWYLTWLTSFVALVLMFVYGMWYGLVYRRWSLLGAVVFVAVQVVVALAFVLVTTWSDAWRAVGHFFVTAGAVGFTGLLAAVAAVLVLGGYATVRHVTV